MNKLTNVLIRIFAIVVLFSLFTGCALSSPKLKLLTGGYGVGTHHFEITIQSLRGEAPRKVSMRSFYPIAQSNLSNKGRLPVIDNRVAKALGKLYGFPASGEGFSRSVIDATPTEGVFPVILFSHGGFSFDTQNLSTFEELVSHGYIVLSFSHPEDAILSLYPSGDKRSPDLSPFENSKKLSKEAIKKYKNAIVTLSGEASMEEKYRTYRELGDGFYRGYERILKSRIEEVEALLAMLPELNQSSDFILKHVLDVERVGIFGHSLGGMTASHVSFNSTNALKATINMDAPVPLFDDASPTVQCPSAFFYSTETVLPGEKPFSMHGANSYFKSGSKYPVHQLTFNDSAHYNFSDFNYAPKFLKYTSMLGKIDQKTMAIKMDQAILAFFDTYLKDSTDGEFEVFKDDQVVKVW